MRKAWLFCRGANLEDTKDSGDKTGEWARFYVDSKDVSWPVPLGLTALERRHIGSVHGGLWWRVRRLSPSRHGRDWCTKRETWTLPAAKPVVSGARLSSVVREVVNVTGTTMCRLQSSFRSQHGLCVGKQTLLQRLMRVLSGRRGAIVRVGVNTTKKHSLVWHSDATPDTKRGQRCYYDFCDDAVARWNIISPRLVQNSVIYISVTFIL